MNESKLKTSHSISETTRKVFFISNTNIKPPSSLFVPTLITAKGLYPPSAISLKALFHTNNTKNIMIPRKSCSVPIKMITMQEHTTLMNTATTTTITTTIATDVSPQKSQSTPPLPTIAYSEQQITKPISIEKAVISTHKSPCTPMKRFVLKKKKNTTTKMQTSSLKAGEEEEEDEPMTKPMSLTEKRKRQAKRADQIKIWKVREEREAREARLVIRRQIVNGTNKKITQSSSVSTKISTIRKKKKRVKFNFDKNCVIELPSFEDELDNI
ncbi:hypothetical protein BD408DRAFT_173749 [Parasitella parasitica]|nr:hypothetical protein BD408DRAFT_173749 [Parasitella parasitica]